MSPRKGSLPGSGAVLAGGLALAFLPKVACSQSASTLPDAQVEANVLKALAGAPELSTQNIQSSTVYGVVTLSGNVGTEQMRTRAENMVARAPGVQKVVDELTLGASPAADTSADNAQPTSDPNQSSPDPNQPVLQSDGSYAPASPAEPAAPYQGPAPPAGNSSAPPAGYVNGQEAYGAQPGYSNGAPPPQQPGYSQPAYQQQPGYNQPDDQQPYASQPGYPQQPNPYGPPRQGYAQPGYPPSNYPPPQGAQQAGVAVTIPAGALLRIRINRGLDSNHTQPGTPFDGTVLNDVAAGGEIAIPRGASVSGVVVDAKKAGALKGEGELTLQINGVSLAGDSFPIVSDFWQRAGRDKTVGTVNSAVGFGALGAIIGAVAGGGAGAAIGAGIGAGAGVAGSAASPGGRIIVPPEAVLSFHLAQPAIVRTVSEQEMQRLAYAAGPPSHPPIVQRRYAYPPPPPGYYPY